MDDGPEKQKIKKNKRERLLSTRLPPRGLGRCHSAVLGTVTRLVPWHVLGDSQTPLRPSTLWHWARGTRPVGDFPLSQPGLHVLGGIFPSHVSL